MEVKRSMVCWLMCQAEGGIRIDVESDGLRDVYRKKMSPCPGRTGGEARRAEKRPKNGPPSTAGCTNCGCRAVCAAQASIPRPALSLSRVRSTVRGPRATTQGQKQPLPAQSLKTQPPLTHGMRHRRPRGGPTAEAAAVVANDLKPSQNTD